MQLSTNRVNFTSSSVAHFNYIKLLSTRYRENNINDIVSVLGLQTDEVVTIKAGYASQRQRSRSRRKNREQDLMVFAQPKKLTMKFSKQRLWYRVPVVVVNQKCYVFRVVCDLRTSVIEISVETKSSVVYVLGHHTSDSKLIFARNIFQGAADPNV